MRMSVSSAVQLAAFSGALLTNTDRDTTSSWPWSVRTRHQLAEWVRDLFHRRLAGHQVEHGLLPLLDRAAAASCSHVRTTRAVPTTTDVTHVLIGQNGAAPSRSQRPRNRRGEYRERFRSGAT